MYSKPVSLLLTNCQFPAIGLSHVSLSHKIKCTDKQKYAYASGLKLDLANLHIRARWITFSLDQTQVDQVVILSNIAVTNNTDDCFIREY